MAKSQDNYGPEYLYAEDLLRSGKYLTVQVTIEQVIPPGTLRTASKKLVDRPTLKFVDKKKMLVLNKTNESVLKFIVGDGDISCASGTSITLEPRDIKFGADDIVALRIMPPRGVKIRKSVADRLGKPASWQGPPKVKETVPETKPEESPVSEQVSEDIRFQFSTCQSVGSVNEMVAAFKASYQDHRHVEIDEEAAQRIEELTNATTQEQETEA